MLQQPLPSGAILSKWIQKKMVDATAASSLGRHFKYLDTKENGGCYSNQFPRAPF
jgi:hypothetical protein